MSSKENSRPSWRDRDRNALPAVEEDLNGIRQVVVGPLLRLNSKVEVYAPTGDDGQGGLLNLSQRQARHVHAELGKLIHKWDTQPRDFTAEADSVLRDAGHVSIRQASSGYEIFTDGTFVYVYHARWNKREHTTDALHPYRDALAAAGYTGPDGSAAPTVSDGDAPRVVAVPPPAMSF